MSRQNPNTFDELDDELHGLFTRATANIAPHHDLTASIQQQLAQGESVRTTGAQRSLPLFATLSAVLVVALLAGVFIWFGPAGGHLGIGPGAPTQAPVVAPTATSVPFTVTNVDLSVSPTDIAGTTCGASASFTYTATFHVPAQTAGGTIQFDYTLNNGRSQTPGTVTVVPGATSATFTFVSSGTLPADHTYPGTAIVIVTSPNTLTSPPAMPTGACTESLPSATASPTGSTGSTGPFLVNSVAMTVNPTSIAGTTCGSPLTVTYTATFHLASNGPGGTIHFMYTVNNGRGSNPATVTVPPGQTTATYSFTWSGNLPPDHTAPEGGGVIVQSPNNVTSSLVGPTGMCS